MTFDVAAPKSRSVHGFPLIIIILIQSQRPKVFLKLTLTIILEFLLTFIQMVAVILNFEDFPQNVETTRH